MDPGNKIHSVRVKWIRVNSTKTISFLCKYYKCGCDGIINAAMNPNMFQIANFAAHSCTRLLGFKLKESQRAFKDFIQRPGDNKTQVPPAASFI